MNEKNLAKAGSPEKLAVPMDAMTVRTVLGSALIRLEVAVIQTIAEGRDPSPYSLKVYGIMDFLETYSKVFEHLIKNRHETEVYGPIVHNSATDFYQEVDASDVRVEKALNHAYHNFCVYRAGKSSIEYESEIQQVIGQCKLYHKQFSLLASDISEASKKFDKREQSETKKNFAPLERQTAAGDDSNQTGQKQQHPKKKTGFIGKLKDSVKDLLQK